MQHLRHVITIKPADKNLGVAIMNTEDYITQCMAHLTDHNTYRLATHYPIVDIKRELQRVIDAFKAQLDSHHKQLYPFLRNGPRHLVHLNFMVFRNSIKNSLNSHQCVPSYLKLCPFSHQLQVS